MKFRQQFAIGQNSNVTCESFGTFAEASLANWSAKESAGYFLPEIFVFSATNTDSSLQLARTAMSPAKHSEHSRKHR
jgi:hypothetical protein